MYGDWLEREVFWERTGDPRTPWRSNVDGQVWTLTVTSMLGEGDYYGLTVDGTLVLFHMRAELWPKNWIRPD